MAWITNGFDGTVTEAAFAQMMSATGTLLNDNGVLSGLTVTASTTTARSVNISTGTAWLSGVLAQSNSPETRTVAANSGSSVRTDLVLVRTNWNDNTVSLVVVQAAGAYVPVKQPGNIYELPLARVTVRPGVALIAAADVVRVAPLPRLERRFKQQQWVSDGTDLRQQVPFTRTLATLTIDDPGWPYMLDLSAQAVILAEAGYVRLRVNVDGAVATSAKSDWLATTGGALGANGPTLTVTLSDVVGPYTGRKTLVLEVGDVTGSMTNGNYVYMRDDVTNKFVVRQFPVAA